MTTPITNDWNKVQTRTIDPYDYVDSDVTNKLLRGFGTKAFVDGLDVYAYEYDPSINTMNVILSSGVAILDTTLIEFNQGICLSLFKLPLDPMELEYDLVLQYDYIKDKQNKSSAKIVSLKKGSYDETLDTNLLLYRFTLNNWAILDLPTWNTWLNTNSTRLKDFRHLTGYVKRSGDIITGNLTLNATPTLPEHIANKKYVDLVIGGGSGSSGFVLKSGDTISGPIKFGSPRTPTSDLELTSKGYNDSIYIRKLGDVITSLMVSDPPYTDNDVINRKYANDTYLKLTGGTMTGKLMLYADPTSPMEATNKQYVDTKINNAVGGVSGSGGSIYALKAGDTLTGPLYMNDNTDDKNRLATKQDIRDIAVIYDNSGNVTIDSKIKCITSPTDNDDLVNKTYVDNKVGLAGAILGSEFLKLTGGTMTGTLDVQLPINPNNATSKAYVDSLCSRSDTHSHPQYIDVNGGTVDGSLQITKYPNGLYDCANKLYVEDRVKDGSLHTHVQYLDMSVGATLTCPLKITNSPNDNTDVVNKSYVDTKIADGTLHTHTQYLDITSEGTTDILGTLRVSYPSLNEPKAVANKKYVDDNKFFYNIFTVKDDGTNIFSIDFGSDPQDFFITLIGGGGAGQNRAPGDPASGRGGGAGQLIYRKKISVSGTHLLTVGMGGENGSSGGSTSFGTLLTALGGTSGSSGGNTPNTIIARLGGLEVNVPGDQGKLSFVNVPLTGGTYYYIGGSGANTIFGSGGTSYGADNSHILPSGFGSGGAGGLGGNVPTELQHLCNGTNGAHGVIIIER